MDVAIGEGRAVVQDPAGRVRALGAQPLVIAPPDLRRYVRAIFERKLPQLWVSSFREIEPSVALRVVESLGLPVSPAIPQQGAPST